MLGDFQKIFVISNFVPLWSNNILHMICILFNLLSVLLWTRIWSILVNTQCPLEKNAFYLHCMASMLVSVRLICYTTWCKSSIFILISQPLVSSIIKWVMLRALAITVNSSVVSCNANNFALCILKISD